MTDEVRILEFHADPSHGWLAAPIDEIREAGLSISGYSYIYRDTGTAYLEEDCDAMVFINYLEKNNVAFKVKETHIDHTHPIRRLERWNTKWNVREGDTHDSI